MLRLGLVAQRRDSMDTGVARKTRLLIRATGELEPEERGRRPLSEYLTGESKISSRLPGRGGLFQP